VSAWEVAKPLVDEAIDQDPLLLPRASVLFYPAALPLSRQTLTYTAGVIRRHRAQIGSPWRKLGPAQQALLVLAYLRKGETFAELAAGFGVAPPPPGGTSPRPPACWRPGPRSCTARWRRRRRQGKPSW
jgi:Helix-turn-helix of DDE superfamily endonuclease